MNSVNLIGRICSDIDFRHTPSGTPVATYRIAVARDFKADNQPDADFIPCVTWGKNAEFANRYLRKGVKIAAEGRIGSRSYDNKDGKRVSVVEVTVERHEFCESKKNDSNGAENTASAQPNAYDTEAFDSSGIEVSAEDLPF